MMEKRTYVLAEIAQGFEGDFNLCKRFVKLAKESNADGVKFQIFQANELCTPDYKYNELFKSLEIGSAKWFEVIKYANELGIDFYADIYGIETFEWISKMPIAGIKIHSTDLRNYRLLNKLKDQKIQIFISAGGGLLEELKKAILILGDNKICILTGFQAEPNLYPDVELDKIELLKNTFKLPVGYADHIDANDRLATILPSMAILKGASVIEKHLTIDRNHLMLEDYVSALNPDEFKQMVELIRNTEKFSKTGSSFALSEREQAYRVNTKKAVLATQNIKANAVVEADDVVMLRTGKTVPELIDIEDIIGKIANRDILREDVITRGDFR
jgi:N,N'-diacetyllegionaminate synthase